MATTHAEDENPRVEEGKEEESEENGNGGGGGEEEEEEFEEEDEGGVGGGRDPSSELAKLKNLARRMSEGPVRVRVHDVVIKGNTKTKDSLIEAKVLHVFRTVSTMNELMYAASMANVFLQRLDIFDSVTITLDPGPPELPDTANVIIKVTEGKTVTGDIGIYSRPEARAWSVEGFLKLKNLLGYGDIWDASGAYGWDKTSQISAGVSLPRFKAWPMPLMARLSLLSQDWLKFSSYEESLLGLSLSLLSTMRHNLDYNLTWRTLTDPSRMASKSIRRQLGHSLLSSMKYTYKFDQRDSYLRPTRGYAFLSSFHVGGLGPDSKSLRFVRQEFDLRGAIPLKFFNSALNIGVAAGVIMPWGSGFMRMPTPVPERFFMGGNSSPVCGLGVLSSVLGFKTRGLGPTDSRRLVLRGGDNDDPQAPPGRDAIGGDLAVTAFADLSFDLPLKVFRDSGIHGHAFATAGNLTQLSGGEYKNFSLQKFLQTFRSSAGVGLIVPTKLFRMEINYCYILKQFDHDRGKTGIQFSFASPE